LIRSCYFLFGGSFIHNLVPYTNFSRQNINRFENTPSDFYCIFLMSTYRFIKCQRLFELLLSLTAAVESGDVLVQPAKVAKTSGKSDPGFDSVGTNRLLDDEQPQVQALEKHDLKSGK